MSPLKSLKAVWQKRWTKGWAKTQLIGASALGSVSGINTYLSNSDFKSYLDMIDVPKSVIVIIAVIGMVSLLAEDRK